MSTKETGRGAGQIHYVDHGFIVECGFIEYPEQFAKIDGPLSIALKRFFDEITGNNQS